MWVCMRVFLWQRLSTEGLRGIAAIFFVCTVCIDCQPFLLVCTFFFAGSGLSKKGSRHASAIFGVVILLIAGCFFACLCFLAALVRDIVKMRDFYGVLVLVFGAVVWSRRSASRRSL